MIRAESIGWIGCPWPHHNRFCRCPMAKAIAGRAWRKGSPNLNTRPTFTADAGYPRTHVRRMCTCGDTGTPDERLFCQRIRAGRRYFGVQS